MTEPASSEPVSSEPVSTEPASSEPVSSESAPEGKRNRETGRVIGVDLGDTRVGIALSNPDRTIASPLEVLKRTKLLHQDIAKIVNEWEATAVIVGLPLSLDGSVGPAAKKAIAEAEKMGATLQVPVETYDERLTTVTAERMMTDAGLDSRDQRKVVDKIAAAIMLQAWLDRRANLTDDHDRH